MTDGTTSGTHGQGSSPGGLSLFKRGVSDRMRLLKGAWENVRSNEKDENELAYLLIVTNSLADSCDMHGLNPLAESLREIEGCLNDFTTATPAKRRTLAESVTAKIRVLEKMSAEMAEHENEGRLEHAAEELRDHEAREQPKAGSVVRINGVFKDYRMGSQIVRALSGIRLNIEKGVFLAISGPSGSGKTTLLNMIGCIDTPSKGKIFINDREVTNLTSDQLADLRSRTTGFVFQTFNLLPVLTAEENVEYPLLYRTDISKAERKKRVAHYLSMVGLTRYAGHRPNQMSGGQRQRVAIARALAIKPSIILADEPTANLDKTTGMEILQLMKEINRKLKTTFIFSTHDQRVVDMANRIVRIEDGVIQETGFRRGGEWVMESPGSQAGHGGAAPETAGGKGGQATEKGKGGGKLTTRGRR